MRKILLMTVMSVGLGLAACGPQVDCSKLDSRLTECRWERYKSVNPNGPDLTKDEYIDLRKSVEAKYNAAVEEIVSSCREHSGRDTRAKLINKCLELKSCNKMHVCLEKVLSRKK